MRKRKDLESMLFKGINIPSVYHPDFCCFLTKTMAVWESLGLFPEIPEGSRRSVLIVKK
jgi:hypothetical protein